MDDIIIEHLRIWSEKDDAARTAAIVKIYSEGIEVIDPFCIIHGQEAMNEFITGLQNQNPGFIFSNAKPIQSHHNIARLFWSFGPASNPDQITGQDIFIFENGKISKLMIFIDES